MAVAEAQQHPIGVYLKIWGLLFVFSLGSYLVDYFQFEGYMRWFLILLFMMLKAGFIVAIFMHMAWERLALLYAIIGPPVFIIIFVILMVYESDYTILTREVFFTGIP